MRNEAGSEMKSEIKQKSMAIVLLIILIFLAGVLIHRKISSTDEKESEVVNSWECSATYAEGASDDTYVITYCDDKIVSTTGILTLENNNDFGIVVYLKSGDYERIVS